MKNSAHARHIDQAKILELQIDTVVNNFDGSLKAAAHQFATHPDFAEARADGILWNSTSLDGVAKPAVQFNQDHLLTCSSIWHPVCRAELSHS